MGSDPIEIRTLRELRDRVLDELRESYRLQGPNGEAITIRMGKESGVLIIEQNDQNGGTEHMSRKSNNDAVEVASHALFGVWHPIESAPRDGKSGKFLVTNNLKSRDAFGNVSHLWLVAMVHDEGGQVTAFDGDRWHKVENLTHWMSLPNDNSPDAGATE